MTTIRKGSTVTMLRPYGAIARGTRVTVVAARRTAFRTPTYDVTDGVSTVVNIPRHALEDRTT